MHIVRCPVRGSSLELKFGGCRCCCHCYTHNWHFSQHAFLKCINMSVIMCSHCVSNQIINSIWPTHSHAFTKCLKLIYNTWTQWKHTIRSIHNKPYYACSIYILSKIWDLLSPEIPLVLEVSSQNQHRNTYKSRWLGTFYPNIFVCIRVIKTTMNSRIWKP